MRRECVKIKSLVQFNGVHSKVDSKFNLPQCERYSASRDTYERVIRDKKGHGIVACVQECEGTVVGLVDKLVVGYPGRC